MQGACRHTNDANTQASMHESFIEKGSFVRWHAAIFSSFAVEHDIRRDESTADESSAIKELLSSVAGVGGRDLTGLHVATTKGLLKGVSRFGKGRDGGDRLGSEGRGFGGSMEGSSGCLSSFGKLLEARCDGHRPTKYESHDERCEFC